MSSIITSLAGDFWLDTLQLRMNSRCHVRPLSVLSNLPKRFRKWLASKLE